MCQVLSRCWGYNKTKNHVLITTAVMKPCPQAAYILVGAKQTNTAAHSVTEDTFFIIRQQ